MQISQVNLTYAPVEDRLLLRLNTQERAEFRLWITRNLAKGLLTVIDQTTPRMNDHRAHHFGLAPEESRRLALAQQTAEADFSTPYNATAATYPLGEQPRLVQQLQVKLVEGQVALKLELHGGQRLDLSLDAAMYKAIARMLVDQVESLDWGLTRSSTPASPSGGLATPHSLH